MARYRVGRETEARIVAATRDLLAEVGLEGTTLKAICERAGIRTGSFYNLFPAKEDAVLRVVGEAIAAVDPDPAGAGTDTVADLVEAYVRFLTDQPALARVYLQVAATSGLRDPGTAGHFLRHHRRRVARFADAIVRERPGADPEEGLVDAEILLGALDGLAFRWALDPTFDFPRHARLAMRRCRLSPRPV